MRIWMFRRDGNIGMMMRRTRKSFGKWRGDRPTCDKKTKAKYVDEIFKELDEPEKRFLVQF
jgi:hypothetical protein